MPLGGVCVGTGGARSRSPRDALQRCFGCWPRRNTQLRHPLAPPSLQWPPSPRCARPPAGAPGRTPSAPWPAPRPAARCAAQPSGGASGGAADVEGKARKWRSSWDAKEAGGGRGGGADFLYELGKSDVRGGGVGRGAGVCLHSAGSCGGSGAGRDAPPASRQRTARRPMPCALAAHNGTAGGGSGHGCIDPPHLPRCAPRNRPHAPPLTCPLPAPAPPVQHQRRRGPEHCPHRQPVHGQHAGPQD